MENKPLVETMDSFDLLAIPDGLKESLHRMEFKTPTPIQAQSIPAALQGRDIVGTAQTGTGKTAAFGIPFLAALYGNPGKTGLVLAPTRELAAQIHKVLRQLGQGCKILGTTVVGGESFGRQAREMAGQLDYIVATPGRLNDHLQEGTVDLSSVAFLVLDEVDRMLDMGFLPQIRAVLQTVPAERQTMLFSATLPREVVGFIDTLVKNPLRVSIGSTTDPTLNVKQNTIETSQDDKPDHLLRSLEEHPCKTLVFVRTKQRAYRLARTLDAKGFGVGILHGGRTQGQRKLALDRFRGGRDTVLVATDLAGRGIDVLDIDHVINFDVPSTREDFIHRIGRTGRAGRSGLATSFLVVGDREEAFVVTGKRPQRAGGRPGAGRKPRPFAARRPKPFGGGDRAREGGSQAPRRGVFNADAPRRGAFGDEQRPHRAGAMRRGPRRSNNTARPERRASF